MTAIVATRHDALATIERQNTAYPHLIEDWRRDGILGVAMTRVWRFGALCMDVGDHVLVRPADNPNQVIVYSPRLMVAFTTRADNVVIE